MSDSNKEGQRQLMLDAGYAPAADAAKACGRELSTIHRWADQEKVQCARSGRRLYIAIDSLAEMHEGNPVIAARVEALRVVKDTG